MSLMKSTNDLITINNHLIEPVVGSGPVTGKFYTLYSLDSRAFTSYSDVSYPIGPVTYKRRYAVISYTVNTSGFRKRYIGFNSTGVASTSYTDTWMYVSAPYNTTTSYSIGVATSCMSLPISTSDGTLTVKFVMDLDEKKMYVKFNGTVLDRGYNANIPDRGTMSITGMWSKTVGSSSFNETTISNLIIGESNSLYVALRD